MPPRRVTRDDIKTLLGTVVRSGAKKNTVKGVLRCVRRHFHWLIDEGRLKSPDGRDLANPAARQGKNCGEDATLDPATGRPIEKVKPLSRDEQAEFLKFFRSTKAHRDYCIVLTGLRAGLRISEVLGLRFDDIDLEGRAITVERQIVVSTGEVGEAKTASSARRVDIYSDVLLAALRDQIHDRKEQNLQRGWRSDFLFVT